MHSTLQRAVNLRAICPWRPRDRHQDRGGDQALFSNDVSPASGGLLALEDVCVGPLAGLIVAALNSEAPADMYIECPALHDGFGLIEMKRLAAEPDFPLASRL